MDQNEEDKHEYQFGIYKNGQRANVYKFKHMSDTVRGEIFIQPSVDKDAGFKSIEKINKFKNIDV